MLSCNFGNKAFNIFNASIPSCNFGNKAFNIFSENGSTKIIAHSGSADYICDGVNDQEQINRAFIDGAQTIKLKNDGNYVINGSITLPDTNKIYYLQSYDENKPVLVPARNDIRIFDSSANKKFSITNIKFNGNNKTGCIGIRFENSGVGSEIGYCEFYNFKYGSILSNCGPILSVPYSLMYADDPNAGSGNIGNNIINIHHNVLHDIEGIGIAVNGKPYSFGDANSSNQIAYAIINNNVCYNFTMPNGWPFPAIHAKQCNITNNIFYNLGVKAFADVINAGMTAIGASRSLIANNKVYGCANFGIVNESFLGPYSYDYIAACKDSCYNYVTGNLCRFNCGGIDYWFADGCIIDGNTCIDNGQAGTSYYTQGYTYMDCSGIDVADHSHNTIVRNNICGNTAQNISTTLKYSVNAGVAYITVNDISKFYTVIDDVIVPFIGMCIFVGDQVGANLNRISSVDIANQRLYLYGNLRGGAKTINSVVVGAKMQQAGINTSKNANGDGADVSNHSGTGNKCSNNLVVDLGPFPGFDVLPNCTIS